MVGNMSRHAMSELAPNSPWKAILLVLMFMETSVTCASCGENAPRLFEVGGSIDTERNRVNDLDIDAHAGFQRTQLLQRFALFQHRWPKRDEALQGRRGDKHRGRYGDRAAHRHKAPSRG